VYRYDAAPKRLMEYKAEIRVNARKRTMMYYGLSVVEDDVDAIAQEVGLLSANLIARAEEASERLQKYGAVNHTLIEGESNVTLTVAGSATATLGDMPSKE
jgi:ribosomal 50S subunit-associated protein YjgA (DUF615 family)